MLCVPAQHTRGEAPDMKRGKEEEEEGEGDGKAAAAAASSSSSSSSSSDGSSSDSSGSSDSESDGEYAAAMILHGSATLPLTQFNADFVCLLCGGYFRECVTLTECLHSFCGSCLKKRFMNEEKQECPRCKAVLGAQAHNKALADHTMQKLCDLLFPKAAARDREAERVFNASRDGGTKRPAPKLSAAEARQRDERSKRARKYGYDVAADAPSKTADAPLIALRLVPAEVKDTRRQLAPLDKPRLRTNGDLRVALLRRHIARRLKLSNPERIQVMCKGQTLGSELSLEFIQKTRWRDKSRMVLQYRLAFVQP